MNSSTPPFVRIVRDPRAKTVAVAVAASSVAGLIGWTAARHAAVPPASSQPPATTARQTAASAASDSHTGTATEEPTLPAVETTDKILANIPDAGPLSSVARVKKVDSEIARLKAAAQATPNDARTWGQLGDALMRKARETANPDDNGRAETCYARSLSLAPRNAEALLGLAGVANTRDRFAESIVWAKRSLAVSPRLPAALGQLIDAYVGTGKYDDAFQTYQTLVEAHPDASSYSRGARLFSLAGNQRKAVWLMDKAAKAGGPNDETSVWCRTQLADMYLGEGATLPAQQIVQSALKQQPDNHDLLKENGKIQQEEGDLKGAIVSYQKAVALTPDHAALVALGDLYDATGDKPDAEAIYDQVEKAHAHRLADGLADELYMARFFVDHHRQMPRALTIAEAHADTQNPVDADTVAWIYYKSGKIADAKTMINRALSKASPDASELYHAGMIYAALNERFPAQEYLNRALSLDPHFSLRDTPIAVTTLHDLGAKPRPIDTPAPGTPTAALLR